MAIYAFFLYNTHTNMSKGDSVLEPEYLNILKNKYFLRPDAKNKSQVYKLVRDAIESVTRHQGNSSVYPICAEVLSPSAMAASSEIPHKLEKDPSNFLAGLYCMMAGSVKAGHPYMVKNLIPTPSLPALATYLAVSLYMGNAVTGEDAGYALLSEIACASAISKLAGLDPTRAAGVFTFGGTSTNLYGMKMGLIKVLPEHGNTGLGNEKIAIIESYPAHYSHQTGVYWMGIGINNSFRVPSLPDQTTDLIKLEKTCEEVIGNGYKIACINAVGGTTSNLGIDDMEEISRIRERIIKKFNLDYTPHLHMDAVLGWAYLNFVDYDFDSNPMSFSTAALNQIKKILARIKTIKYADSFGVDFHKTGYVAYTSSMVIVNDKADLERLQREVSIMTPLFHDDEAYNPGKFTLETSRSTANILATWVALQTFGKEGYQALLGHAIEMGLIYRNEIEKLAKDGLYVANQNQYGPDVFVRCYPPGEDPAENYEKEMSDNILLKKNSDYTSKFFKWLNAKTPYAEEGFAVSKSSAAIYTPTGQPVIALRIYPLSPYITEKTARILVTRLRMYKQEFDRTI